MSPSSSGVLGFLVLFCSLWPAARAWDVANRRCSIKIEVTTIYAAIGDANQRLACNGGTLAAANTAFWPLSFGCDWPGPYASLSIVAKMDRPMEHGKTVAHDTMHVEHFAAAAGMPCGSEVLVDVTSCFSGADSPGRWRHMTCSMDASNAAGDRNRLMELGLWRAELETLLVDGASSAAPREPRRLQSNASGTVLELSVTGDMQHVCGFNLSSYP